MEQLDREGYHYSDGFKEELTYYIDTVYDSADFKDVAFISDLMRRIILQMEENEGSDAYKDNVVIDESFVPYSQKVQIRRSQEDAVKTSAPVEISAPVETSTSMELEDLFCDKSPCSRADFSTESESGKNAGIFLVLSAYNARSTCSDYNVVSDSSTVVEDTCTYKGIQTNDAPVQHLIDEVYRSGYNLKKIVCITTPKVLDSSAGDGISNYERFQNLAKKYAESVWNETGIEITNIVYNNETDSPDYDKFYKDLNEESGNLDAFFVDYTGGLRDMSFLMVVAIRFLEFKNIECKKVIYSDFFSSPKKIKCLDSVYNLFQMINGMNEFVSSGTTRQLDDIFQKENPLILAIRNFSHATNVGDMAHIDEFVHKLAEELEKNTASGNLKDIMISSMNEIIRKKIFGVSENLSLIENGRIDYCRLIEWCIENKMYQQAATLYIEKIPVVYWQDGIITDLVKLSSNTTMPDSSEVATFYTELPAQLFSTTEKTLRDLLRNVVTPSRNKWNHNEFIKELKRTLVHYPDICQRLTDIITTYYKNFDRKTGFCSIEEFDIQIEGKNIRTFMNYISEAIHSDIFYYLIHGNLDGYAGRKKSKGSEKTRLLHNLIAFWDLKDAFPKTSNDALLCRLLAFYLAIKILRNKMSHAAENIVSSDMELTDSLEKFLNEIEETNDIKISLSENDIHTLLNRAMKYSGESKESSF